MPSPLHRVTAMATPTAVDAVAVVVTAAVAVTADYDSALVTVVVVVLLLFPKFPGSFCYLSIERKSTEELRKGTAYAE